MQNVRKYINRIRKRNEQFLKESGFTEMEAFGKTMNQMDQEMETQLGHGFENYLREMYPSGYPEEHSHASYSK